MRWYTIINKQVRDTNCLLSLGCLVSPKLNVFLKHILQLFCLFRFWIKWPFTMLACMGIWWALDGEHFFESSVETLILRQSFTPTLFRKVSLLERCLLTTAELPSIHLSINIQSLIFKMRRVCVCVCTRHAMIQSSLAQWQRHSFLCISFQFNRADSQVNRLSAHSVRRARMGEMQSAKKQHTGHIQSRKMTPFLQENP